jgi:hypothetical protein
MAEIRIENEGHIVGTYTKVFFVGENGKETDISKVVTGVDLSLRVGDVSQATLHVLKVKGSTRAEVADMVIREVGPPRFWWFKRRLERIIDVTPFGARCREVIS